LYEQYLGTAKVDLYLYHSNSGQNTF